MEREAENIHYMTSEEKKIKGDVGVRRKKERGRERESYFLFSVNSSFISCNNFYEISLYPYNKSILFFDLLGVDFCF